MAESPIRAMESQFRHACLESGGFEAESLGRTAEAANPPASGVEHGSDVFTLDVDQADAVPFGGAGR